MTTRLARPHELVGTRDAPGMHLFAATGDHQWIHVDSTVQLQGAGLAGCGHALNALPHRGATHAVPGADLSQECRRCWAEPSPVQHWFPTTPEGPRR
jgi:hypothetical protein